MSFSKILIAIFGLLLLAGVAVAQDPVPLYPQNYKVLLENDRVRVLDFQLKKGAKEDFHAHPAAVTYVLAPFGFASKVGRQAWTQSVQGAVATWSVMTMRYFL